MSNKRILKAYERYDYNGRVVSGSLVLRDRIPKNGRWKEMDGYLCCNPTTTTTTTAAPSYPLSICLTDNAGMFILSGTLNFTTLEDGYPVYVGILNTAGFNPPVSYTIKHFLVPPNGSASPNGWCRYSTAGGPGSGIDDYSATTLDLNPTLAIWNRSAFATLTEGACS